MLINAINQMNRSNGRYIFLDQARISGFGQLELVTTRKKGELKPQLYIRGSISQVDEKTSDTALTVGITRDGTNGVTDSFARGTRNLSIVSVDMHLVEYPSRRVLAGGSVANSMVVKQKRFEAGATGFIAVGSLGVPFRIERIESQSQAVRNLIEVGAIELIGRHASVPYWTCLGNPTTDPKNNERLERAHRHEANVSTITSAQSKLVQLGFLQSHQKGVLDDATRKAISSFQDSQNLLPNGVLDFDTLRALNTSPGFSTLPAPVPVQTNRESSSANPKGSKVDAPAKDPECVESGDCSEVYKNLYHFLKEKGAAAR